MRTMRILAVVGLAALAGVAYAGAEENPQIHTYRSRIAVLCSETPKEPAFYDEQRLMMWDSWGLRYVRFLYRLTGKRLEARPSWLVALLLLLAAAFAGSSIAAVKRKRRWPAVAAACFLGATLVFSLNVQRCIYCFEKLDRMGLCEPQRILDVLVGKGLDFRLYDDWETFRSEWDSNLKNGVLPFSAVVWAGKPQEAHDASIAAWIKESRVLPLIHGGKGPWLPQPYHAAVFGEQVPRLHWERHRSVCEPQTYWARPVCWRASDSRSRLGVFPFGAGKVIYGTGSASSMEFGLFLLDTLAAHSAAAYPRANVEGLAVLRMDDPGAAQSAHLKTYLASQLTVVEWQAVQRILESNGACMTIGYVEGWVDDGDAERGDLWMDGVPVTKRLPGATYASGRVRYFHRPTGKWYELSEQADFLRSQLGRSLDPEVHGYTHITPDVGAWLRATNRATEAGWYREFLQTDVNPPRQRPRDIQVTMLKAGWAEYRRLFGVEPSTLIPPGNAISFDTSELAREAGFRMLCDGPVSVVRDGRMFRSLSVKTVEFSKDGVPPEFVVGFPIVAVTHDLAVKRRGEKWFDERVRFWKGRASRLATLRELSVRLCAVPTVSLDTERAEARLSFSLSDSLLGDMQRCLPEGLDLWIHLPRQFQFGEPPPGVRIVRESGDGDYLLRCAVHAPAQTFALPLNPRTGG